MANTVEIGDARAIRPWWPVPAGAVAALAVIGGPIYALHAAGRQDDVVLARNEVAPEALGGRTWYGALANGSDDALADISVQIRFHDREGRPAGAPLSARAARLDPGAVLHLQARLPAEATGLRIHALRWTVGGRWIERHASAPLPFGALPD